MPAPALDVRTRGTPRRSPRASRGRPGQSPTSSILHAEPPAVVLTRHIRRALRSRAVRKLKARGWSLAAEVIAKSVFAKQAPRARRRSRAPASRPCSSARACACAGMLGDDENEVGEQHISSLRCGDRGLCGDCRATSSHRIHLVVSLVLVSAAALSSLRHASHAAADADACSVLRPAQNVHAARFHHQASAFGPRSQG